MACGEFGPGRMAEPLEILAAIENYFSRSGALTGRRALITSGPTREPIDPVRYISNHSSGKQGHAIATALARLGADTLLVSGPTAMADPQGVRVVHVETAQQMLDASLAALPVDVAVCAAAVADWRVKAPRNGKIKKEPGAASPSFELVPNPDILATLAQAGARRPQLLIGFAAETDKVLEHAIAKRLRKGCDWIVANDVSPATGTFGGDRNTVHLIGEGLGEGGVEHWPTLDKAEVARLLAERVAAHLARNVAA
jgi:phosphopantothenoylcysteine decarboxylase/phosphopantothenate--cysteine ligase